MKKSKHSLGKIKLNIIVLLFLAETTSLQASEGEGLNGSLFELIMQGGWSMIPLFTCSMAVLFLTIYAWMETKPTRFVSGNVIDRACSLIANADIEGAKETLLMSACHLSRSMNHAMGKIRVNSININLEKAEDALMDQLTAREDDISQWINYLNVTAAIAPMIGLLGTVSGMISAFQTIGQGGMGRPELLAGNIGEALITTAAGLVIGIPAMLFYFILKNRLSRRITETIESAEKIFDQFIPLLDVPQPSSESITEESQTWHEPVEE